VQFAPLEWSSSAGQLFALYSYFACIASGQVQELPLAASQGRLAVWLSGLRLYLTFYQAHVLVLHRRRGDITCPQAFSAQYTTLEQRGVAQLGVPVPNSPLS
jgi:hypothetical protein